jgi:hypothetical protein
MALLCLPPRSKQVSVIRTHLPLGRFGSLAIFFITFLNKYLF